MKLTTGKLERKLRSQDSNSCRQNTHQKMVNIDKVKPTRIMTLLMICILRMRKRMRNINPQPLISIYRVPRGRAKPCLTRNRLLTEDKKVRAKFTIKPPNLSSEVIIHITIRNQQKVRQHLIIHIYCSKNKVLKLS